MSTDCNTTLSKLVSSLPADVLLELNAAGLVETLFYGIHFVLFCICMFILLRNRRPTQWFILASVFVMFTLSTADISITFRLMTHDIGEALDLGGLDLNSVYPVLKRIHEKKFIFISNNGIDLVRTQQLYRCYMIWSRSKYLLVLTSFLVIGDTVLGYLSVSTTSKSCFSVPLWAVSGRLYLWSVFAINIVISGITVGRIIWVSHIARPVLGHRNRHFRCVVAILLESSAVYSTCLLFSLILKNSGHRLVTIAIAMRVVAIMPTLLIVQVGLLADHIAGDASDCERPGHGTSDVVLDTVVTTNHESQDTSGVMGTQTRDTLDDRRDLRRLSFPNVTPILRAREG